MFEYTRTRESTHDCARGIDAGYTGGPRSGVNLSGHLSAALFAGQSFGSETPMAIRARLDDAAFLYSHGRREGALLNVLVAVAATSRRRYPSNRFKDNEAFTRFVGDEMAVITAGGVKNFSVRVPGGESAEFPDGLMPLGVCFYRFVRCNLAHEAMLSSNVEFIATPPGGFKVEITDEKIRLSDSFMDGLSQAVIYAPENADVFPDVAEMPPEVIAWNLFGKRRQNHADYMARRQGLVEGVGQ